MVNFHRVWENTFDNKFCTAQNFPQIGLNLQNIHYNISRLKYIVILGLKQRFLRSVIHFSSTSVWKMEMDYYFLRERLFWTLAQSSSLSGHKRNSISQNKTSPPFERGYSRVLNLYQCTGFNLHWSFLTFTFDQIPSGSLHQPQVTVTVHVR